MTQGFSQMEWMMGEIDRLIRESARRDGVQLDGSELPYGRSGIVTREDIERTKHRIVYGDVKDPADPGCGCWRW